jgi:copper homeostasis protein
MDTMIRAIAAAREAGADGVVLGRLTADRQVDIVVLRALAPVTRGLSVTFHRAFDEVANPLEAMEELIMLGVSRILTSGGAPTARKGETVLANLVSASRGRIGIIACGKVRPANVRALIAATGVSEVHAHLKTAQAMRAMAGVVKGKARREK